MKPMFDRMPPHNLDAERSVLGAMLLNNDAVGPALEILGERGEDMFYAPAHAQVYAAAAALFRANVPVDAVTLGERLTQDGHLESIGGYTYIAELTGAVPTSANVEYYARIVRELAVRRQLSAACRQLSIQADTDDGADADELLERAESTVFAIARNRHKHAVCAIQDHVDDGERRIADMAESQTGVTGVPTGFARLDQILSGLHPSDLIVLAARTSVGKTAFALNVALHAAKAHRSVLIFSLEMSKEQLVDRLLCMEGGIDTLRLRTGFLAKQELHKAKTSADALRGLPLYFADTPALSALDLRAVARRHASAHPLDLVIVDYLQLMHNPGRAESRQLEIAAISRSLKQLACELRVPILALSQLSREADRADAEVPKLSHLRESGAIEQDADVVVMLARPPAKELRDYPDLINAVVAKNRKGPTGKVRLLFDRSVQRFKNLLDPPQPAPPASARRWDEPAFDDDNDEPF